MWLSRVAVAALALAAAGAPSAASAAGQEPVPPPVDGQLPSPADDAPDSPDDAVAVDAPAGDSEDPAAAADLTETPQVTRLPPLAGGRGAGFLLRAPLPGAGRRFLGVYVACAQLQLTAAASFGPFPEDGRPVQLAVRGPLGDVDRFGPVVRHAGAASGFHSPLIDDPDEARRFVAAAFRQGALISNGYRSLWNRVDESENAGVRFFAETCG